MRGKREIVTVLTVVGLMAVLIVGCGGGGSTSSAGSTSGSSATTSDSSSGGGEPSAEFAGKGKNGELATVGKEASVDEREAASQVLEESLTAREEGDWAGQCETLYAQVVEQIVKTGSVLGAGKDCAAALELQAKPTPASARVNTMSGPIAALRVIEGERGFAFWHGTGGADYVIPMLKENGEWKVASLKEEEAP
jgi:hypothetical protein